MASLIFIIIAFSCGVLCSAAWFMSSLCLSPTVIKPQSVYGLCSNWFCNNTFRVVSSFTDWNTAKTRVSYVIWVLWRGHLRTCSVDADSSTLRTVSHLWSGAVVLGQGRLWSPLQSKTYDLMMTSAPSSCHGAPPATASLCGRRLATLSTCTSLLLPTRQRGVSANCAFLPCLVKACPFAPTLRHHQRF